ncbi:MAG: restriction endonuclease, partial [Sedimentisphaerales bacterium]
ERQLLKEYSEEELEDVTTQYLSKEEYRKLPSVERNQIALDRFCNRQKSKWLIGRLYERYIGYLYEKEGYNVEYVGIFKGFEDLGRDLICHRQNDFIVIQCKNWSKFSTIHEKHIFQFFGTVFQYKDENPDKKVKAIFYTSTELSKLARRFASELNIELKENFKLDKDYPSIKCHTSKIDGTKIYHLPFDQQYDKTKIEKKYGEFYCKTVKEAEDDGFRRAFRYRINKQK